MFEFQQNSNLANLSFDRNNKVPCILTVWRHSCSQFSVFSSDFRLWTEFSSVLHPVTRGSTVHFRSQGCPSPCCTVRSDSLVIPTASRPHSHGYPCGYPWPTFASFKNSSLKSLVLQCLIRGDFII